MSKTCIAAILFLLTAGTVTSQSLTNGALAGKYFFRHMMLLSTNADSAPEIRTAFGAITFNGSGSFSYTGSQITGTAEPAAISGNGNYSVKSTGYIVLDSLLRQGTTVNAGLGQGAVLGSTTEAPGVSDLFVAIQAPVNPQTNASFTGTFDVSALEFHGAIPGFRRNAHFRFTSAGNGSAGNFTVTGKSADTGGQVGTFAVAGATYSLTSDGNGTFILPGTGLLRGGRTLWLSADGNIALIGSTRSSEHDFWIATKSFNGSANTASFRNLFFRAGLRYELNRASSFSGSSNSTGNGKLVSSLRYRQPEGVLDFTGANLYTLNTDGTGTLELSRLALGLSSNNFQTNGVSLVDSANYEISLAVRAASPTGTGVFVNPQGVVNAASFAPVGAPLSPGGFFTIFGSGLAASTTVATGLPFPTTLGNVRVLVNDTPAPLYLTSAGQISALVPFAATGATASIVVVNNGQRSNTVELPLARTSPGIFTIPPAGTGPGALLHANFSLISPNSPARRGETVQLFLTGLGPVSPATPDGAAAPSNPLSFVTSNLNVYVGGRPATVIFKGLAPGLAGLYQINFTVPASAAIGSAIPLAIETPEGFHDMADIAVAN